MSTKPISPEEEQRILKDTEKQPDAKSENLIIDENGKPQPYKPGVAEGLEQDCGNQPGDPGE
jgi:hypothetical protein